MAAAVSDTRFSATVTGSDSGSLCRRAHHGKVAFDAMRTAPGTPFVALARCAALSAPSAAPGRSSDARLAAISGAGVTHPSGLLSPGKSSSASPT
jgi:hypothetical protein